MAHAINSPKPLGVLNRVIEFFFTSSASGDDEVNSPLRTRSHLFRSPPIVAFESPDDSGNPKHSHNRRNKSNKKLKGENEIRESFKKSQ